MELKDLKRMRFEAFDVDFEEVLLPYEPNPYNIMINHEDINKQYTEKVKEKILSRHKNRKKIYSINTADDASPPRVITADNINNNNNRNKKNYFTSSKTPVSNDIGGSSSGVINVRNNKPGYRNTNMDKHNHNNIGNNHSDRECTRTFLNGNRSIVDKSKRGLANNTGGTRHNANRNHNSYKQKRYYQKDQYQRGTRGKTHCYERNDTINNNLQRQQHALSSPSSNSNYEYNDKDNPCLIISKCIVSMRCDYNYKYPLVIDNKKNCYLKYSPSLLKTIRGGGGGGGDNFCSTFSCCETTVVNHSLMYTLNDTCKEYYTSRIPIDDNINNMSQQLNINDNTRSLHVFTSIDVLIKFIKDETELPLYEKFTDNNSLKRVYFKTDNDNQCYYKEGALQFISLSANFSVFFFFFKYTGCHPPSTNNDLGFIMTSPPEYLDTDDVSDNEKESIGNGNDGKKDYYFLTNKRIYVMSFKK